MIKMLRELFGILLLVVTLVHLMGVNNKKVIYWTKPLLMPLIIAYYVSDNNAINWLLIMGLIFGLLGDIFLMLPKEKKEFFMLGLVSFLIGHIFYIVVFTGTINSSNVEIPLWFYFVFILPYIALGALLMKSLAPHLGKLLIPTIVYMVVILLMSFSALCLYSAAILDYGWVTYLGSLLFVSSDSILAWDKFKAEIKNGRVYVMSTYIAGQFLIMLGFVL